jgi:hypothetical protein
MPPWFRRIEFGSSQFRASALAARPVTLGAADRNSAIPGNEVSMDDDFARAARAKKGSPFLSTEQAAFYLGLSARKMQAMRGAGTGPRFRRHSRYVRYHIDDLDSWSSGSGIASAQ